MLKRIVAFMTVCSIVGVLAIMQSSTPSHSSPLIILLVFLLLYVSVCGALTFLLYGVRLAVVRISKGKLNDHTSTLFSILVAVQSIGGLKLYEIILVVVFETVAIFYVHKQQ